MVETHLKINFTLPSSSFFRCLALERQRKAKTRYHLVQLSIMARWDQFKISGYQLWLWLLHSRIGSFIKMLEMS
jgi:hypothetical protein